MALTSGEFGNQKAAPKSTFRFDQNPMAAPAWPPKPPTNNGGVAGTIPWIPPAPAPAPYQAPYQAPAAGYAQGNWDAAPVYNGGGVSVGGSGGGGGQAAAPPAPPPRKTSDDFASQYNNNDKGLALVDSTFGDQQSQYAQVLKKYIEDYTRQSGDLTDETKTARAGVQRNKANGLTGQAEDFFARGVGNSGMFAHEQQQATNRYDEQDQNMEKSRVRQQGDLDFRKAKFEGENGASGSNVQAARREAYNRLALKQQL